MKREGYVKVSVWSCQWMDKDLFFKRKMVCFVLDIVFQYFSDRQIGVSRVRYIVQELRGDV